VRIFSGKAFAKWAKSEKMKDDQLCKFASEAFAGEVEADLGGYLFKKRIARAGGGKSGGYRTIIAFRKKKSDRIVFLVGFPKNKRGTITKKEQAALSIAATSFVDATDDQVAALKKMGSFVELECKDE